MIDAKNMAEHAGKLTEGAKALLENTRRSASTCTRRTAPSRSRSTCSTTPPSRDDREDHERRPLDRGARGLPLPDPRTAYEAMWNHLVRFNGAACPGQVPESFESTRPAAPSLSTEGNSVQEYPFWDPAKTETDTFWRIKLSYTGPARRAGEALQLIDPLDIGASDRRAWIYLPGQRRVKVAPDLSHDTPNPGTAGGTTFDDTFIFNGSMDRFDFALIGKQEMYVPYNAYRCLPGQAGGLVPPTHLNPTCAMGAAPRLGRRGDAARRQAPRRHQARCFILDEDSWAARASDQYDGRGELYRAGFAYAPSYDLPRRTPTRLATTTWSCGCTRRQAHCGDMRRDTSRSLS